MYYNRYVRIRQALFLVFRLHLYSCLVILEVEINLHRGENQMPTLGNRLRELRKEKALSREDLANAIGISVFAVKSYELGQREPNSKAMAALERFFNVSGAYLRGETNERERRYWENPEIISDMKHIDEKLIPALLSNYQKATDETQFNILFALSQINNLLSVDDVVFQQYGSKMLSHFCSIAYNFIHNYQQLSQANDHENPNYQGIYSFYMDLLGRDLIEIQKLYFPQSPDPNEPHKQDTFNGNIRL